MSKQIKTRKLYSHFKIILRNTQSKKSIQSFLVKPFF